MKKLGLLLFIVAIVTGVVLANIFSFGHASGKIFTFSMFSGVKGSGVAVSEGRDVDGFRGVEVSGAVEVEIKSGGSLSVQVQGDDNLLQYVRTEVSSGVLHIGTTSRISPQTPIKITVSTPDVESVTVSGASRVELSGLKNSSFDIDMSGASKIRVVGETTDLSVKISGASKVDARELHAKTADVNASGASKAEVFVTDRIESHASGASKITYSGDPRSVSESALRERAV